MMSSTSKNRRGWVGRMAVDTNVKEGRKKKPFSDVKPLPLLQDEHLHCL
jgi:hypothetical protein